MGFECKVLADSVSERGHRLTTLQVTFPRIILAQFNTHRMLSRNSASSRAIPVEKMLERVAEDPFIPETWGANQKGMQAGATLAWEMAVDAKKAWVRALVDALSHAKKLATLGLHKQHANRLLEPFMWQTVIVSATEWDNLFALRCDDAAQPEFQTIACMMRGALAESTPTVLGVGEWHLPLVPDFQRLTEREGCDLPTVALIASARCARVSYLTHDGTRDPGIDRALASRLLADGHLSPFEHAAYVPTDAEMARTREGFFANLRGWRSVRNACEQVEAAQ